MAEGLLAPQPTLQPGKFRDPDWTAKGERRAHVALSSLETLWFNTGTLCNIACDGCYIESSPTNDRLVYLSRAEVAGYLAEIQRDGLPVTEIGFTGGEPFMNKDMTGMLEDTLAQGFRALVLTNAMKPMHHKRDELLALKEQFGAALCVRVSIDHCDKAKHEAVRGRGTWDPMMDGLKWLSAHGFNLNVAGRMLGFASEAEARDGYARLFAEEGITLDCQDPIELVLFPEMDPGRDVPEITTACWDILDTDPATMMCASQRMVVKRKGQSAPVVIPCTLLPYGEEFEMGPTLADAAGPVKLNHPNCAAFCVLGGASCSAKA